MNNINNQDKSNFVSLFLAGVENDSHEVESAKSFLESEDAKDSNYISEGLKRIKQLKMVANAKNTEIQMANTELVKEKAISWVNDLLSRVNFSLSELVQQEELSVSFRNMESLSEEDIKIILIKHFTLKFLQEQNK